jgi:hypothetical protein
VGGAKRNGTEKCKFKDGNSKSDAGPRAKTRGNRAANKEIKQHTAGLQYLVEFVLVRQLREAAARGLELDGDRLIVAQIDACVRHTHTDGLKAREDKRESKNNIVLK